MVVWYIDIDGRRLPERCTSQRRRHGAMVISRHIIVEYWQKIGNAVLIAQPLVISLAFVHSIVSSLQLDGQLRLLPWFLLLHSLHLIQRTSQEISHQHHHHPARRRALEHNQIYHTGCGGPLRRLHFHIFRWSGLHIWPPVKTILEWERNRTKMYYLFNFNLASGFKWCLRRGIVNHIARINIKHKYILLILRI